MSYITAPTGAATIYEESKAIGRLMNALCDQCLFAGAIENASQIDNRPV
jgi:hypothetical protein